MCPTLQVAAQRLVELPPASQVTNVPLWAQSATQAQPTPVWKD